MKKIYSRNIRNILSVILFLLTLSTIIYSCRKEAKETNTLQQPQQSLIKVDIAALKEIYNKAIGSSNGIQTLSKSFTLNFIRTLNVNWDTYTLQKRKDSSIVAEFDMKNDTGLFLLKKLYPGDTIKFVNKTTVTFIKFKDGSRLNFFTKIIEDLTLPHSHSVLNKLHYNQVTYGFNGMILYYTLDRKYINGYRYVNGGIQGTIDLTTTPPTTSDKSINSLKPNEAMACDVTPIYQMFCQTVSYAGYTYDSGCTDYVVGFSINCSGGGSGGGGGGGSVGGDTGGGGGAGGSNSPAPTPPDPCSPPSSTVAVESVSNGRRIMVVQQDPVYGGGGTGNGSNPPCATYTNQVIRADSLNAKYPCAVKLILNNLLNISTYQTFTSPFNTNLKPDLTWDSGILPWNQNSGNNQLVYQLGITATDNRSAKITLNSKMLQNSSQLLIASAAIHETLHAVINYNIQTASGNYSNATNSNGTWFDALTSWYSINPLPSNFRDHYEMLDYYFATSVSILAAWDNNANNIKNYQMAMLYGLDNGTDGSTTQKQLLQTEYQKLLTKYSITANDLDTYWKTQLNSSNAKLPTTGCN